MDAGAEVGGPGVSITWRISNSMPEGNASKQALTDTEQHRDLVDLQLVQDTGLERPVRRVGAVHSTYRGPRRANDWAR
jgi:hypothetical protein